MSFMFVTCPWCGENYTWGIQGTTFVGSGHSCVAEVTCDTPGCGNIARFRVGNEYDRGDTIAPLEFSCGAHLGDRIVMSTQPRPYDHQKENDEALA